MPTIYTHGGDFHSDEMVAIASIQQLACPGEPVELVRTRNKDRLAEALADETTYVVDVGLTHDPDRLNFDHHQEGGADAWEDGRRKQCNIKALGEKYGAMVMKQEKRAAQTFGRDVAAACMGEGETAQYGRFGKQTQEPSAAKIHDHCAWPSMPPPGCAPLYRELGALGLMTPP